MALVQPLESAWERQTDWRNPTPSPKGRWIPPLHG